MHHGGGSSLIQWLITALLQLCCSFLPPNILVKLMMSDRDFYISPQLTSHPCPPSTFTLKGGLTHAHQSSPHYNPPPSFLHTHRPVATHVTASCLHPTHLFPPSNYGQKNQRWVYISTEQGTDCHVFENRLHCSDSGQIQYIVCVCLFGWHPLWQ